jgi:endoglucanase
VTSADLADLWTRLSGRFRAAPALYAYDLVNEPIHARDWHATARAVVAAIRAGGDRTLIVVAGSRWESAGSYGGDNGPSAWVDDPAGNLRYSAHLYFDHDNSGTYALSYHEELAKDADLEHVGSRRLAVFTAWCAANHVRGIVGEFGVPADPRWQTALEDFYRGLDAAGCDGTWWAAGEWWGGYGLSVCPRDHFTADAPQLAVMLRHLGAPGR